MADPIAGRLAHHLDAERDPCQDRGVEWPCDVADALTDPAVLDWRAMFARYADLVGEEEGIDFLNRGDWTDLEREAISEACGHIDWRPRQCSAQVGTMLCVEPDGHDGQHRSPGRWLAGVNHRAPDVFWSS